MARTSSAPLAGAFDPGAELGPRLRRVREDRGLSARELARRINCSPSLISQIERGISAPSVGMLYALATELRTSLDFLFGVALPGDAVLMTAHGDGRVRDSAASAVAAGPPAGAADRAGPGGWDPGGHGTVQRDAGPRAAGAPGVRPGAVQRPGQRRTIDLASGVRWERLTPGPDDRVDFLEVIYEPSGHSTDARRPLRHDGHEYGLITSGTLHASVGFESYLLGPGDSIAFDSSIPHEYWNASAEDVHAIWVVVHATPGRA
jgi:DNA-binding XRE family transcriptional regulator/mannose-6-phosphate isomerase-like protein (cupin superfamily)